MDSLQDRTARVEALSVLSRFRQELYDCLTLRADALFELTDAVLCAPGAMRSAVELTLVPSTGAGTERCMTASTRAGSTTPSCDRCRPAAPPVPEGRPVLAVDVSPWLRSDAPFSPDRLFCHVYGRAKTASQFIPGWPYSFVVVREMCATSSAGWSRRVSGSLATRTSSS